MWLESDQIYIATKFVRLKLCVCTCSYIAVVQFNSNLTLILDYRRLGLLGAHGYYAITLYQAHDVLLIISTNC